jgi:hypothetical protein
MLHLKAPLLALACTLGAAVACSQSGAKSASAGTSDSSAASAADASDDAPPSTLDCAKVFVSADAVGILNDPAKVSAYPSAPGWCIFETARESGAIKISGGSDFSSEMSWNDVTKSRDSLKYTALPGVGDRAVRKASDGTEILAKKGKVYCAVELPGIGQPDSGKDFTKSRGEELSKKLGALCNKYFAAS